MEPLKNHLIFGAESPQYGNEPYIYRNIPKASPCSQQVVAARMAAPENKKTTILTPHPNPFTHDFTMRLKEMIVKKQRLPCLLLRDTVERFDGVKANTDYSSIGNNWPKGMYIVKVNRGGVITTHALVKK